VMAEAAARSGPTALLVAGPPPPPDLVTSAGPGGGQDDGGLDARRGAGADGAARALVDCDLRRSRLHQVFGLSNDVGCDHRRHGSRPRGVGPPRDPGAEPERLAAGPAVPRRGAPAQRQLPRLLDELGTRFDRIVLDSSPVALVTDAAILASLVDATLLVVRAAGRRACWPPGRPPCWATWASRWRARCSTTWT
jgi:Mrp family chromosome partitioning ATPase